MDFRDTPAQAEFRQELRSFLASILPPDWAGASRSEESDPNQVRKLLDLQKKMADSRWIGVHWPTEYGGRGAGPIEVAIYNEELARAKIPHLPSIMGTHICGPAIAEIGTDQQKERYLPKILDGTEIWCQGFSEPNAGSDVASLSTRAEDAGDSWIVNGQKVWTTMAHIADWCLLITRTDPRPENKHQGMTALLVDMHSPGVEVRPLIQITGDSEFNEVYFTDVKVPKDAVLGEVGGGWKVIISTLMHERANLGTGNLISTSETLKQVIDLAAKTAVGTGRAIDDPRIADRIADAYCRLEGMRFMVYRTLTDIERTGFPGPQASAVKLVWSRLMQELTALAVDVMGPSSQLARGDTRAIDRGEWEYKFLRARGNTIEAGTSEILLNILGERVLGLPKDAARA